jgi:SAM-dependent methyltransferase
VLSFGTGQQRIRALDAGCGITPFPHVLATLGLDVDAIDFDEGVIDTLNRPGANELYGSRVNHQRMDLRRLAFPDATFDVVTCVSVIERLGCIGDETLALKEIVRVLRPGGKAIVTTDVACGDNDRADRRDRKYDEAFRVEDLVGLLAPYAGMIGGSLDGLKVLRELRDEDIGGFWRAHWHPGASWQGNRGYVALGFVLSKTGPPESEERPVAAKTRGRGPTHVPGGSPDHGTSEIGDLLVRSQIRRILELHGALEEKEEVIQEQKRAIDALNAHVRTCPLGKHPASRRVVLAMRQFLKALRRGSER